MFDILTLGTKAKIRIQLIILIEILLLIFSVVVLTVFESQTTDIGEMINIAGKNRFLTESIIVEMEKYRIGGSEMGNPILDLSKLRENINFLKPENFPLEIDSSFNEIFESKWHVLDTEYILFSSNVNSIIEKRDAGFKITENDFFELDQKKTELFDASENIANSLSIYSRDRSLVIINLQIFLTIINIITHIILIFLIVRILNSEYQKSVNLTLALERELEKSKNEKMITIGQLSSRLAHDLRNPLSIIQISLENLKILYGTNDTKQKQFDKVERSIDRIVHQVDDVLNFVREQPAILDKHMMSEIISESLDSLAIPSTVKLNLPENDVRIICDKKQLAIALNNLILNGIQAINSTGTIDIIVEKNNDGIIIRVKDSGKGIPEENIEKIFEPLFTTKQAGTGLGLASVKSIVESHGGTISVTSPPTIFTITLPKTNP